MSNTPQTLYAKHVLNGRFTLAWLPVEGQEGQWKYWATFTSREDAEEWLNSYVLTGWPEVKWEIVDNESTLPTSK